MGWGWFLRGSCDSLDEFVVFPGHDNVDGVVVDGVWGVVRSRGSSSYEQQQ
jgi:hypothetical protein